MNLHFAATLIILPLLSGCLIKPNDDGESVVCTTEVVPALVISIIDKETKQPTACGATITIHDGDFSEQHKIVDDENCDDAMEVRAANERAGIYNIYIAKTGYVDWVKYDVQVTENTCHVETIKVKAEMEK